MTFKEASLVLAKAVVVCGIVVAANVTYSLARHLRQGHKINASQKVVDVFTKNFENLPTNNLNPDPNEEKVKERATNIVAQETARIAQNRITYNTIPLKNVILHGTYFPVSETTETELYYYMTHLTKEEQLQQLQLAAQQVEQPEQPNQ